MSITQYPPAATGGGGGDIDEIYELGAIAAINQDSASLTNIVASPEAMNVVAASDKAQYAIGESGALWDAIKVSNMAIGKLVAGRGGLAPSSYADMDAVVASQTAIEAVGSSQIAMDAAFASQLAVDKIDASNMAIGKLIAGRAGLEPSSYADMDAVVASQTAMNAVAASQTAMDAVVASQTAMDTIVASQTAMDAIGASNIAIGKYVANLAGLDHTAYADMDAIAASNTALTAIFNSWDAREAIWDSILASDVLMDTSNSNTWMRSNVTATTNVLDTPSYTLKVDKKVLVLQSQATASGQFGYVYGGGYRYIQPGDGTYFNGSTHNVARTDRVQPLELRSEIDGSSNRETVTYVQMQE